MIQLCCGLALVAGTLAASHFSATADLFRFPLCWAGVLIALDGAVRLRRGASPLARFWDWLACAAASVLFWDIFELVDLRLKNWWYRGVSPNPWAGAAFGAISFATVLPAVRLGLSLLRAPEEGPLRKVQPAPLFAAGAAALALAMAFPGYAFPLAWLFLWPLCEAALTLLPRRDGLPSPLEAPRLVRPLLLLALPLGLVWESLNWRCVRGWFYTVPFFDHPKLFEMPLPGYLGYLPFLLEAGAALALLDRLRPYLRKGRGALALAAVLAIHLGADRAARRQTVVSFAPVSR